MEDVEINFRFLMGDQANATQTKGKRALAVPTVAGADTLLITANVINALERTGDHAFQASGHGRALERRGQTFPLDRCMQCQEPAMRGNFILQDQLCQTCMEGQAYVESDGSELTIF